MFGSVLKTGKTKEINKKKNQNQNQKQKQKQNQRKEKARMKINSLMHGLFSVHKCKEKVLTRSQTQI